MIYTHVGQHGNVAPHPHLACAVMVPCTSGILLHSCLQHVTTSLSFSIYILSEHDYSCDSTWKMLAFWKRSFPFGMASWRYLSFKECSSKSFPNEDFNSPTIPNSWSTPTNVFFSSEPAGAAAGASNSSLKLNRSGCVTILDQLLEYGFEINCSLNLLFPAIRFRFLDCSCLIVFKYRWIHISSAHPILYWMVFRAISNLSPLELRRTSHWQSNRRVSKVLEVFFEVCLNSSKIYCKNQPVHICFEDCLGVS